LKERGFFGNEKELLSVITALLFAKTKQGQWREWAFKLKEVFLLNFSL